MKIHIKKIVGATIDSDLLFFVACSILFTGAAYAYNLAFDNNQSKSNMETAQSTTASLQPITGVTGTSEVTDINTFSAEELLRETNLVRANASAGALTLNDKLTVAAQAKCDDLVNKNYWAHRDPEGSLPWKFVTKTGYSYSKLGENLAAGHANNLHVINGWMASPTHKENMLDRAFKEVGFGICKSDSYIGLGGRSGPIIVQHLGLAAGRKNIAAPKPPAQKPYVASVCTKTPIPYKTITIEDPYRYVGNNYSYGGTDGYLETCTTSSSGYKPSDFRYTPYDKTIYVGTKPLPTLPPPPPPIGP